MRGPKQKYKLKRVGGHDPSAHDKFIERVIKACTSHGQETGKVDDEVGDLQKLAYDCWRAMPPSARNKIMRSKRYKNLLADYPDPVAKQQIREMERARELLDKRIADLKSEWGIG